MEENHEPSVVLALCIASQSFSHLKMNWGNIKQIIEVLSVECGD